MAYYRPILNLRDWQYDLRYPKNTSLMTGVEELGDVLTLTPPEKLSLRPVEGVPLRLHVENRSPWLWKEVGRRGGVKLSLRWVSAAKVSSPLPEIHLQRLNGPVHPGKSIDLDLLLPAPSRPGSYQLAASWIISGLGATREKTLLDITVVAP